jgi:hypothetical protein
MLDVVSSYVCGSIMEDSDDANDGGYKLNHNNHLSTFIFSGKMRGAYCHPATRYILYYDEVDLISQGMG